MTENEDIQAGSRSAPAVQESHYYRTYFHDLKTQLIGLFILVIGILTAFIGAMYSNDLGVCIISFIVGLSVIISGVYFFIVSRRFIYVHYYYPYPRHYYRPLVIIDEKKREIGFFFIAFGSLLSLGLISLTIGSVSWRYDLQRDIGILSLYVFQGLPIYLGLYLSLNPYSTYYYPPELYQENKNWHERYFKEKMKKRPQRSVKSYLLKRKLIAVILIAILAISPFIFYSSIVYYKDYNPYRDNTYYKVMGIDRGNNPCLSQDGEYLIYFSTSDRSKDVPAIWKIDIDGSDKIMLYENRSIDTYDSPPDLSLDGGEIIFCSRMLNEQTGLIESSIDMLTRNGTEWNNTCKYERLIINPDKETEGGFEEPSFSPDGSKIVYRQYGGNSRQGDIFVIDKDGKNKTRLTARARTDFNPQFSYDGEKILYQTYSSSEQYPNIWIMNSDGSNKKSILSSEWRSETPSFLPDGRILFESRKISLKSNEYTGLNTWIMDQDGGNKIMIAHSLNNGGKGPDPTVGRNGSVVLYDSYDGFYYITDPEGRWNDRDDDGVWDEIDGAPDDPYAGYKIGYLLPVCNQIIYPLIVAGPSYYYRMRKTSYGPSKKSSSGTEPSLSTRKYS